MTFRITLLAAALTLCGVAEAAPAGRASANLMVSATVLASCVTTTTQTRVSVTCNGATVTMNTTGATTTTPTANITTTTATFPNEGGTGFYTVRTITYDE